jgi:hypothetical protein
MMDYPLKWSFLFVQLPCYICWTCFVFSLFFFPLLIFYFVDLVTFNWAKKLKESKNLFFYFGYTNVFFFHVFQSKRLIVNARSYFIIQKIDLFFLDCISFANNCKNYYSNKSLRLRWQKNPPPLQFTRIYLLKSIYFVTNTKKYTHFEIC